LQNTNPIYLNLAQKGYRPIAFKLERETTWSSWTIQPHKTLLFL
jgi:hypothetical protein